MREIKFRAWDKEKKVFVKGMLCFGYDDFEWVLLNDNYEQILWNYNGELQQYTGLKDKNGVEIYEGDVVKSNSHKPTTFKIEFIEGGFCATQSEHNYPLDINHFYPSTGCMIEVIGNIYENPELLETK